MDNNYFNSINKLNVSALSSAKTQQSTENLNAISQYKGDKSTDIKQAYKKFEGMFISQMLNTMFDTIPVSKELGGGSAEETFRTMLVDEYGMKIAQSGGMGIASIMQKQYNIAHGIKDTPSAPDVNKALESYNRINKL